MGRWTSRAVLTGALVLAVSAVGLAGRQSPISAANDRPGLRLSKRTAIYDDPGVLAIVGRRADEISRVWFGSVEIPAIAPSAIGGTGAAIPPGDAGERVVVRVLFEDGTGRNAGRFLYRSHLAYRNRLGVIGHGGGCSAPDASGRERDYGASTRSRVRRLGRDRFRYTYSVRNRTADDVTFTWPALRFVGLPDALTVDVPAGETFRVSRESSSPPVPVFGTATTSAMPGCLPNGDTEGDAWPGEALVPADTLPTVPPPKNVHIVVDGDNTNIEWTAPVGDPIDFVHVTKHEVHPWQDLFDHGRRWRNHVVHDAEENWVPATETTFRVLALGLYRGVTTFTVRSLRDGVQSEPVHIHVIR